MMQKCSCFLGRVFNENLTRQSKKKQGCIQGREMLLELTRKLLCLATGTQLSKFSLKLWNSESPWGKLWMNWCSKWWFTRTTTMISEVILSLLNNRQMNCLRLKGLGFHLQWYLSLTAIIHDRDSQISQVQGKRFYSWKVTWLWSLILAS